ncbi:hypothetical protein EV361DRAFT_869758 [Lentinula raphanica]|nr:hypothetical protein EV361DRAFT_869758 [Lentinula raphanica]
MDEFLKWTMNYPATVLGGSDVRRRTYYCLSLTRQIKVPKGFAGQIPSHTGTTTFFPTSFDYRLSPIRTLHATPPPSHRFYSIVVTGHPVPPTPAPNTHTEAREHKFVEYNPSSAVKTGPVRTESSRWCFVIGLDAFSRPISENMLADLIMFIGTQPSQGYHAIDNPDSDPKLNLNWPWEAKTTVAKTPVTAKGARSLGQIRFPPGSRKPKAYYHILKEKLHHLQFQGRVGFIRVALDLLKSQRYITAKPSSKDVDVLSNLRLLNLRLLNLRLLNLRLLNEFLLADEAIWRERYATLVRSLCDEAEQSQTNTAHPQTNSEQPQTNADHPQTNVVHPESDAKDSIRWKLHRLFYNNCRTYHSDYKLKENDPPSLEILLSFGKGSCRIAARSSDKKS